MKRLLFLILILIASPSFSQELARMNVGVMGGGAAAAAGCGATSEPAGDVYSDGFEGTGYELAGWTETASADEDYALSGLSGGSGETQNCDQGLQVNAEGTAIVVRRNVTGGLAQYWRETSFYVISEGLTDGLTVAITCASSDTGCSANINGQMRIKDTAGQLQVQGLSVGGSTYRNISIENWYYAKVHAFDIGDCTDVDTPYVGCTGAGTGNHRIWIGTTYGGTDIANGDTFAGGDVTVDPDEFGLGVYASRTINIVFGYDAVDDDGTF